MTINSDIFVGDKKNMKRVKNGFSYEKNGWTYISIKGTPSERGYAHGYLIADKFKRIQEMMKFMCVSEYGETWEYFIEAGRVNLKPTIMQSFREYYDEMNGIAEGCCAGGTKTTLDEILAWNNSLTLLESWYPNMDPTNKGLHGSSIPKEGGRILQKREGIREMRGGGRGGIGSKGSSDRCSAFMATGDYTKDGKIVLAHNTFDDFITGQYTNVILDMHCTSSGHRLLMQTSPGFMWSGTDFAISSHGIVMTETTIGGFVPYENNYPISCRIRKAMQYGTTLDECVKILLDGNSGDYANSWMFGDIRTNEILRIELGLKYHNIERTKSGYFVGFNATYDPRIRNLECVNSGFDDIRRHQGARRVRLTELMEENKGKLTAELAKTLIADHFDVYLNKINPCSRTVCSHYDLDAREFMSQSDRPKPFSARGALDGCVADSNMLKRMSFWSRWGNSCGTSFRVDEFCKINKQWAYLQPYLNDRLRQPWTRFSMANGDKMKNPIKKGHHKKSHRRNTLTSNHTKKRTIKHRK